MPPSSVAPRCLVALLAVGLIAGHPKTHCEIQAALRALPAAWVGDPAQLMGMKLTFAARVRVTHLGLWDRGADGLPSSFDVGLFDAETAELLAYVTVGAGRHARLIGGFRYAPLESPIPLRSGGSYVVAVYDPGSSAFAPLEYWIGPAFLFATGHGVRFESTVFADVAEHLAMPHQTSATTVLGPSLLYVACDGSQ